MRKVAQREDIRDLILDATDQLLARYGYKKMTIDDLAQTVGIGKGTVYLHFPSKEELILCHIDRIVERVTERLKEIAISDISVEKKIEQMLIARVMIRFRSVQHYTESLNALLSAIRSNLLARRQQHFALEAEVFAQVLHAGAEDGIFFLPTNVMQTAETLLVATNALLPYALSSQELGQEKAIEIQVTNIAHLLLYGLTHSPADHQNDKAKRKLTKSPLKA